MIILNRPPPPFLWSRIGIQSLMATCIGTGHQIGCVRWEKRYVLQIENMLSEAEKPEWGIKQTMTVSLIMKGANERGVQSPSKLGENPEGLILGLYNLES